VTVSTPTKTTVLPGGFLTIRNGTWQQTNSGDLVTEGGAVLVDDEATADFDRIQVTDFETDATGSIGVFGVISADDTVTIGGGEGRGIVSLFEGVIEAGNNFDVLSGGELRGTGVARALHFNVSQGSVSPTVQLETGARGVPNPIGTLVLDGDYTQSDGGTMLLDVAGTKEGAFDVIEITGDAVIEGPVILSFIDGFAPKAGQEFGALLDVVGIADVERAQFIVQNLTGDFEYDVTPMANGFMLTALTDGTFQQATPGDYDNSGQVEQADLDLVLLNWGESGTPIPDGWINDLPTGLIDQAELDGVLLNWGNTNIPAASSSATPAPEPATLPVLAVAALAGWAALWRCRRTSAGISLNRG